MPEPLGFEGLVDIMDRLRGPDGCPWDREQDYQSLRGYLLEECYEVAEALDRNDADGLCEELGDLLFQIVFLSRIAKEEGRFTVADVIRSISEKMIRRHPHVFGDATADNADEVLVHWERIKEQEKAGSRKPGHASALDGVPRALPALLKAQRLGTKAARVGFDWERPDQVLEKVDEELAELREAMGSGDREATREELGDLFFSLAMLARKLDIDPEGVLEAANLKFARRFTWVEQAVRDEGGSMAEAGLERLEGFWRRSKDAN